MNILCNNIDDFCSMISTCTFNGIKDVRLFISEKDTYRNGLITANSIKDHKKFTYIFFSPLYTAIYTDSVYLEDYNVIYNKLETCQEQCNHDFRIQVFDSLSFNFDTQLLTIGKEINVI